MLNVASKLCMMSVIILNVVMLNVAAPVSKPYISNWTDDSINKSSLLQKIILQVTQTLQLSTINIKKEIIDKS